MKAVELFGGAGGMALGIGRAGFQHDAMIELDPWACETLLENKSRGHEFAKTWQLHQADIRTFDYSAITRDIHLLAAGLPCQPFSQAGKSKAHRDKRDLFAEVVRAARELQPQAILIENVKGLVRTSFKEYFDYLVLALGSPGLARSQKQSWQDHFDSLRDERVDHDLKYDVHVHTVNAADYGVPQWRERVLIVAFRSDLRVKWFFPPSTHSMDALLWSQIVTREYWKRHGLDRCRLGKMSRRFQLRARAIREWPASPGGLKPWRTVRDAISDLPRVRQGQTSADFMNHFVNRGARAYTGHSGSLIDEPAKTLKAGNHGVPGGENSLDLGGQKIRYFSVRECARLQTFPDDYSIAGPWSRAMKQIGNAVPVALAECVADRIRVLLEANASQRTAQARVVAFPADRAYRKLAS